MEQASTTGYRFEIDQVREYLPHRFPFLMVDRILEIHPKGDLSTATGTSDKVGTKVVGIKNVTVGEEVFLGHFPGFSIYPGVLIVEAMAQVASFSLLPYVVKADGNLNALKRDFRLILVGIDQVRFRKPVIPGDTLRIEATVTKCRGTLWGFHVEASVDGKPVAEAEILANLNHQSGAT